MISSHNEREYICNQCDNKEDNKEDYEKHMKVHKTQKENETENNDVKSQSNKVNKPKYVSKRIKCNMCDKKFNKKDTFQKHVMKIHGATETEASN